MAFQQLINFLKICHIYLNIEVILAIFIFFFQFLFALIKKISFILYFNFILCSEKKELNLLLMFFFSIFYFNLHSLIWLVEIAVAFKYLVDIKYTQIAFFLNVFKLLKVIVNNTPK